MCWRPRRLVRRSGIASRVAANIRLSWPLAPVGARPSGVQWESTTQRQWDARLAAASRVRAGRCASFLARTLALLSAAHDQFRAFASGNFFRSMRCGLAHTPATCHSPSRHQLVRPLQSSELSGMHFHGRPVRSTELIPANADRSEARERPPFGFAGSGGRSAAITAQTPSGTRASMLLDHAAHGFVPCS